VVIGADYRSRRRRRALLGRPEVAERHQQQEVVDDLRRTGGDQRPAERRQREQRDGGDGSAIDELRGEVDALRRELAEVHERLDFTERLLARHADRDRLPGSPPA